RSAPARLRSRVRPAARGAVLLVPGFRFQGARRDRGRLLRALPRADGRVPRVDQDRAADHRGSARGPDLVTARPQVGRPGARAEGRGLHASRGSERRSRLLPHRRWHCKALSHEVAWRVVLESRGAAAHHPRPRGRRRRGHHGLGRSRLRRGGSLTTSSIAVTGLIAGGAVLGALLGLVAYVTLLERKFAARMQSRIGPYRVGPHGLLQPIADGVKLLLKEDIIPTDADKRIFTLAPLVFVVPCLMIFATIPFAPGLGVADLNIGVLFFMAVSSMEIVGLFMAGWSSNNKYALISAMRAVNQIISYDLPFIMAALVPVLLTGSLKLSEIAHAQEGLWFIFYPVIGQIGFVAYVVAAVAAENRVPFDILEAESELVAGFRVEYSGMKFAIIQLGEYAHVLGTSFLGSLLFLGAWAGPGPWWLGPGWFLLKALLIFLLITWVRWSFIRIRVDQILQISWKLLLPLTVLLVMATAVTVVMRSGTGE